MKKKTRRSKETESAEEIPRCGLCGKTENLTKTPCCDNWICNDDEQYVMFSNAQNSCSRNHRNLTLCGFHFNEGHEGNWQDCQLCKDSFETEIYVDFGTNEYNFEKLKNPPSFEDTRCSSCDKVIILSEGGYSLHGKEYYCEKCTEIDFQKELERLQNLDPSD